MFCVFVLLCCSVVRFVQPLRDEKMDTWSCAKHLQLRILRCSEEMPKWAEEMPWKTKT